MNRSHLGILVKYRSHVSPPFVEKGFFKILSQYGQKIGVDVTVFSPTSVLWKERQVVGYRYHLSKKEWVKGTFPLPPLLYDRIAYSSLKQIRYFHAIIKRLVDEYNVILLGRGLPGKWKVFNMLKDIEEIKPYIPETIHYAPNLNWGPKLIENKSLFFKPASGSHGKGVIKVTLIEKQIHVQGRDSKNLLFEQYFSSFKIAKEWMKGRIGKRSYVIQPYLELNSKDESPFDIRILVQKNQQGVWQETGRAIRVGKKATLTSNLNGGGTALKAKPFLEQNYSPDQLEMINEQIQTIVDILPQKLEQKHGSLLELGIDIGVDRSGNVWILEVNSKPGRESLKIAQDKESFINSLIAPVRYTQYVSSQFGGR
jgi:glutathione synthase/RimK-type ligase-like ATP-grasp enzyme